MLKKGILTCTPKCPVRISAHIFVFLENSLHTKVAIHLDFRPEYEGPNEPKRFHINGSLHYRGPFRVSPRSLVIRAGEKKTVRVNRVDGSSARTYYKGSSADPELLHVSQLESPPEEGDHFELDVSNLPMKNRINRGELRFESEDGEVCVLTVLVIGGDGS